MTKIATHLFLNECRRNTLILIVYAVSWGLFQYHRLVTRSWTDTESAFTFLWVTGAMLLASIGLGDNLARKNVHWRIRPTRGRDWWISRTLFVFVWIILPVVVFQVWIGIHNWLQADAIAYSVLEVTIKAIAFSFAILALSAHARNWGWLAGIAIGCYLIYAFSSALPNPFRTKPTGSGFMYIDRSNYVFIWIVLIFLSVGNIALRLKKRSPVLCFGAILTSITVVTLTTFWIKGTHSVLDSAQFQRTNLSYSADAPEPHSHSQKIRKDLYFVDLEPGEFIKIKGIKINRKKLDLDGRSISSHMKSLISNTINPMLALQSMIPPQMQTMQVEAQMKEWRKAEKSSLGRDLKSILPKKFKGPIRRIQITGDAYQWVEIDTVPLRLGGLGRGDDISFKIQSIEKDGIHISFTRPVLEIATRPSLAYDDRWEGLSEIKVLLIHKELKEAFFLRHPIWKDRRRHRESPFPFSALQQKSAKFDLPAVRDWEILWSNENDQLAVFKRWAEGAEVRVYTRRYMGKVDTSIELPAKK